MISLVSVIVILSLLSVGHSLVRQNSAWMLGRRLSSPPMKLRGLLDGSNLPEPLLRIGHGYDIHRLSEGKPLVISGVRIPFKLGADAHSDGDAVYHSVVDAILGALALPDIGQLFPDNDPRWRGADSSIFMEEAYRRMTERGYRISNLDVTLILQAPKVKDLKAQMRTNIARLLRTDEGRVGLKARTHEEVDSVGQQRAYECHVVVLLERTTQ